MPHFAVRPSTHCHVCSKVIDAEAVVCTGCGVMQPAARALGTDKKILPTFLLAVLFGVFGAHRFFVGKIGTGILQLVTLGGLGIWALVDLIMIITGNFTDKDGDKITEWT
jgi:TM2 domain-containing membrane protein YozV